MANFIRAYRSGSYGPPNVTDKYSPLANISFDAPVGDYVDRILMRRWQVLNMLGLLPQRLNLALPDTWDETVAVEQEEDRKPPLVVISSNRSSWIKNAIAAGKIQLTKLKIPRFDNASDLRALMATSKQKLSPPMYAPSRIGSAGSRSVYVLVHAGEYQTYKANLAGTGITVVGWGFQQPRRDEIPLCGFGASRFAAIEFCKKLRTDAGNPWDYAWLFDDNVVAFTNFAGYLKVEAVMDTRKRKPVPKDTDPKPYMCAGFSGGSATISAKENAKWANRELDSREGERGKEFSTLPDPIASGIIQQAALWNIAELTRLKLNFGPIFVASGEDVSFGAYFDLKGLPYLYYDGITVRKEDVDDDGTPGAQLTATRRNTMAALFAEAELIDPSPYIVLDYPAPIMIKPMKRTGDRVDERIDDSEQTLGNFIVKSVLPNASRPIQEKAANANTQNVAMCQATEQTICKAIKLGHVGDAALNRTFRFNGDADQRVEAVQM